MIPPLPTIKPPPALPALRAPAPVADADLLRHMAAVIHMGDCGWRARAQGCKDYSALLPTPTEAMRSALAMRNA